MESKIEVVEMDIGDADEDRVIDGREQAPKYELDIDRSSSECPDKDPRD